MKIKAGKYTLALVMITSGILMLINMYNGNSVIQDLWKFSPVVLIAFGLEVIILNLIYSNRENYEVKVSIGSIFLMIIVIAILMAFTNDIQITGWDSNINIDI